LLSTSLLPFPPQWRDSGDFRAAAAAYTAGVRHAPSAALLANRAAAALHLGVPRDALRDSLAALQLDARHVKARTRAARACQVRVPPPAAVAVCCCSPRVEC
jgi:hypothetical protein